MNDFLLSLMLLGSIGSADSQLPYWATTNQFGIMPEHSGGLALLQAGTQFDQDRQLQCRWGASLAANCEMQDPHSHNIIIDELYGSLRWKVLTLDVGSKRRELDFYGADPRLGSLSVTGGHIVESGNARTMPGYNVTHAPVALPFTGGKLRVWGEWGDYWTTDVRYVQDALIHRTRIGLSWDIVPRLTFGLSLDHYAMWGGHHPTADDINVNLSNYLRVVTGRGAGEDGNMSDRLNVIGDQGGGEMFSFAWRGDGWKAEFRHDIPYADGSGMGFQNFPDGVNTLHFGYDDKDRWISDVVYEYHYTMYQSGTVNGEIFDADGHSLTPPGVSTTGLDNYFNNGYYRSGWTHYGRAIGTPLCIPKGTRNGSWWDNSTAGSGFPGNARRGITMGFESNRYKAHHIGMGGKLWHRHPYRLMLTLSKQYGIYAAPYEGESQKGKPWGTVKETGLRQFSAGFNGSIEGLFGWSRPSITYGICYDRGQLLPDNFGLSLGLRYTI